MSKEKPVPPTKIYDPDLEESLYSRTMERDTLLNTEPVIFEPLKSIKLSRATYKVTSYINFDPYLQSFGNYRTYLNEFQADLKNPKKMGALMDMDYSWMINHTETDCHYWLDKSVHSTLKCRFLQTISKNHKRV